MLPDTGWGKTRTCSMYLPAVTISKVRNTATEIGPVQVGDLSGGLRAATWRLRVDSFFDVYISTDGFVTSTKLFNHVGLTSPSLTFDLQGYPVVVYEVGGVVHLREYDGFGYPLTILGTGSRPKVHLDLRSPGTEDISDIVIAYTIDNKVYTRSKSDSYTQVYTGIRVPVGSYVATFGMTVDHRMQLSIVESSVRRTDGITIAIGHETGPFVSMYTRQGNTYVRSADVDVVPGGTVRSVAFSPDGNLLVMAHDFYPFVSMYMRSDDDVTFNRLDGADLAPPRSAGMGVAFSPDGTFICFLEASAPYVTFYKIRGERLSSLGGLPVTLPGNARGVAFSPDSKSVAIVHSGAPFLTRYSVDSGSWMQKLPVADVGVAGVGRACAYSNNGRFLAVAHNIYPFLTLYENRPDGTLEFIPTPTITPSDTASSVAFSPDSSHLVVGGFGVPYLHVYSIVGLVFTALPNPSPRPAGAVRGVAFDVTNEYIQVAHQTFPFFSVYRVDGGRLVPITLGVTPPSNNAMSVAVF